MLSTPAAAQDEVRRMLHRHDGSRPTPLEVLQSPWLEGAAVSCQVAFEQQMTVGGGWGLWNPSRPDFAERLKSRTMRSWGYKMVLGLVSSGLSMD